MDAPAPAVAAMMPASYPQQKRSVDNADHDRWIGFGQERVSGAWCR
ncbi:hypothetical protein USDA257_p04540 (plasmid) [Sinorhizobium fredii USDA 257]|uniref:Uncharacterized protein n=1 Tax=Sinorhizobium fredii (strain USDA 257) TaxID=1185652 RepID=I3XH13_SINF2|nr:hypothetical protein USDA257_p04540 [Sinorhizobium fredii USDA 257]